MSSIEKAMGRLGKEKQDSKAEPGHDALAHNETVDRGHDNGPDPRSAYEEPLTQKRNPIGSGYHGIPLEHLKESGYLTPNTKKSKIAEEYGALKRPLLLNAFGKGVEPVEYGNIIMVVSAFPGEGKTFTSYNLAISMAMERDITVLLVDTDIVKPGMSKLLGLKNNLGLTEVLLDSSTHVEDYILRTNVDKLSVLPAGSTYMHSTELLASSRMAQLVHDLSNRYSDRIVIFDGPPLLATTEASVLSRLAGQILIVVEAGRTPQIAVNEAVSKLDENKVIGMMLNKSRPGFGSYGGGYGYY